MFMREQDPTNDKAHENHNSHIEPKGLDVPRTKDFLTAVERSSPKVVARSKVHETGTRNNIAIYDIQ